MEGRIGRYVGPCHVRKDECMHEYRHSMETVMEKGGRCTVTHIRTYILRRSRHIQANLSWKARCSKR